MTACQVGHYRKNVTRSWTHWVWGEQSWLHCNGVRSKPAPQLKWSRAVKCFWQLQVVWRQCVLEWSDGTASCCTLLHWGVAMRRNILRVFMTFARGLFLQQSLLFLQKVPSYWFQMISLRPWSRKISACECRGGATAVDYAVASKRCYCAMQEGQWGKVVEGSNLSSVFLHRKWNLRKTSMVQRCRQGPVPSKMLLIGNSLSLYWQARNMLSRFSILSIDMLCDYVMLQHLYILLPYVVVLSELFLAYPLQWLQARGLADLVVPTATAMRRMFDAMGQNLAIAASFCLSLVLRFWRLVDRDLPGTSECCDSVSWSLDAKPIKTWFGKCLENLFEDVAVSRWFVVLIPWGGTISRLLTAGTARCSLEQLVSMDWMGDMTVITARICMLCWLSINVWLLLAVVDWFFFTMLRYSPFCIRSLARV